MTTTLLRRLPLPSASLALLLSIAGVHAQPVGEAPGTAQIRMVAQPLASALNELARQSGLELMVQAELVAGKSAPALSGRLTPQQALDRLLAGSGLSAVIDGRAVIVRAAGSPALPLVRARAERAAAAGGEGGPLIKSSAAGSKTDTLLLEMPQSISVVGRQQLEDQKPRAVPEALNYTPGTFTGLVGASNRYDYVALRGFKDSSVDSTLLDGLRLLSDQGSYTSMQVDPFFLERIDVVRGPASVLYGRASPGGVVALTSMTPQFQPQRELEMTLGNRGRVEAGFNLAGPVDAQGVAAYRLMGLARGLDSQFQHVKEQRQAIAPSLALNISKDTVLLLQAYFQHDPQGSYHSGVPVDASLTTAHNGRRISRHFFDGDPSVEQYRRTQRFLGYQLEHHFNPQWKFRQHLRHVTADTTLRQVYGYGWAGPDTLTRYYSGADESTRGHTVDNQLEGQLETGRVKHTVVAGLDYQKRRVDGRWSWGNASPLHVFTPSYGNPGLSDLGGADIDRRLEQTGVYLQDQMALGAWRLTLGGRHDRASASNLMGMGRPAQWRGSKFTKRAGAVYLFDNGLAPYISYADGFNPGVRNDEAGQILPPAESRQTELGLRYQPLNSATLLSAAVYELSQDKVATRPVGKYYDVPAGKVRSRGMELEARTALSPQLSVQASYTFTDMSYVKSASGHTGNTPYQAPRHMASTWADWRVAPGYALGAGIRHVGSSWGDDDNSFKARPYTLVDLVLRVDLQQLSPALKGSSLRVAANNLFDKTYVASCYGQAYCYWGDARSVVATLAYRW